jgi:hypothetical protein
MKFNREAARMATLVTATGLVGGGALVGALAGLIWTVENASPWVWGPVAAVLGIAFVWVWAYLLWKNFE